MMKIKDLSGQKFGRLTIIEIAGQDKWGKYHWLCQCSCGNTKIISGGSLRNGDTKSCGCLHREIMTTHGMKCFPEYIIWKTMKGRCLNKKNRYYKNWGGRGITVCKDWINSFETFYKDMGKRPKGLTMERIDNSKGYSKANCKWATWKEQNRNKRNNVLVEYKGQVLCVAELAEKLNLPYSTLRSRLKKITKTQKSLSKKLKRRNLTKDLSTSSF